MVDVRIRIEPGLPKLLCDRTMVEQVLLNLARNGMQAMDNAQIHPRILEILVRSAPAEQSRWIAFSVTDQGRGIPPEVASQLFTPFFTTKTEGMGLGLSLCRTVVEQHGGVLNFTSDSQNGTQFSFTLPATDVT